MYTVPMHDTPPQLATKACTKCGLVKPLSDFYPRPDRPLSAFTSSCKACQNAASRAYQKHKRQTDPEWVKRDSAAKAANYQKVKHTPREQAVRHAAKMRYNNRVRQELLAAYGGKCTCCGETHPKFLALDHINGGGHQERKLRGHSTRFYAWLRRLGFPKDSYRLLCHNCNYGRFLNNGVCPHEERK